MVGIIARGKMLVQSPREQLLDRYATPAFEVESTDAAGLEKWAGSIKRLAWVSSVTGQNSTLRITVRDEKKAKHELLKLAAQSGLIFSRYEEMRPSLEDVFLQLVGTESVA